MTSLQLIITLFTFNIVMYSLIFIFIYLPPGTWIVGRCCKCGKFIWPGSASVICSDKIHKTCHQKIIEKAFNRHSDLFSDFMTEIHGFEQKMGTKTQLELEKPTTAIIQRVVCH